MTRTLTPTRLAVVLALAASTHGAAHATDARALALGGTALARGEGVPGALANPASMMGMNRRGEDLHVGIGVGAETRIDSDLYDVATDDNDGLIDDLDSEFDAIDFRQVSEECRAAVVATAVATGAGVDPDPTLDDTICLDGLRGLSTLSARAIEIGNAADDETPGAFGGSDIGVAFTGGAWPFALHLNTRVTGVGRFDFAEADREYLDDVRTTLSDDVLTFGEISETAEFDIDDEGNLSVDQPEAELESSGGGGYIGRITFGASVATSLNVAGIAVDLGVTPKLSTYLAQGVETSADVEFGDDSEPLSDRFDDSETSGTSFTFDVGVSTQPTLLPIPVVAAAVLRNVIPESIETPDGITFETTPQLAVGGAVSLGLFAINADLALNEAKVDGRDTQVLALGVESGIWPLAFRAGINHEAAREEQATALSLGLGLGPVDFAIRAASPEHTYTALQLSLSF